MRRLTVPLNALATSCAGERRERLRPFWLESDEKGHHTNPILPGGLRPRLLRVVRGARCESP
jgi:hypothetical protein